MANEQNLKPIRSTERARELGAKGGRKFAENQRRRKTLKESMNLLLEVDVTGAKDLKKLVAMGIPAENIDNSMLLTAALFQRAKAGDVAAYKEIRDLIGESGDNESGDIARLIAGLKDG